MTLFISLKYKGSINDFSEKKKYLETTHVGGEVCGPLSFMMMGAPSVLEAEGAQAEDAFAKGGEGWDKKLNPRA